MNKKLLFVIYLLLGFCPIYAQTSSLAGVKAELNAMFSGLDKTRVNTGYLWDTAVNLVESEDFNGTALTDSNCVSLPVMGDLLYSINSASVGADTICVQAALSRITRNSSAQNVMLGILFKPYNYIVANALTDNLINYTNGVVSDAFKNGVWQNPYGESVLFGYAVGNEGIVDESTTFTIANVDSLSTQMFQSIQFDPGDGNGFRTVAMGGTINVSYLNTGYVETKLKVTVGGQTYQSHGRLQVQDSEVQHSPVPPDSLVRVEIPAVYQGLTYKAKISYLNTTTFNKRPLIVSEGFDPWTILKKDHCIHGYSGVTDINDILVESFSSNYDIIYIDWFDFGADIRANAEVLKAVICWVNSQNQSGQPNIVLGQSMGGLIARYALRDMELHNEPHNTTLFISHDVPYLGANVSPGLLYTYWDLYDLSENWVVGGFLNIFNATKDLVPELKKLGGYTSVKQMLPLYMNSFWNYDPSVFNSFQQILNNYGFPRGDAGKTIENVAIINGGKSPSGSNSLYSAGDLIVDAEVGVSSGYLTELLLMWLFEVNGGTLWPPGKTTLSISHKVYPYLNHGDLVRTTIMTFKKKLLWLNILDKTVYTKSQNAPSTGPRYDAYTCSYYKLDAIDNGFNPQDTIGNSVFGHLSWDIQTTDKLAFIPTASAMAMPNEYERDFLVNKPTPRVEAPFDSYFLSDTSTFHTDFFHGVSNWLNRVVDNHIEGPDVAFTGDRYYMEGPDSTSSVIWTTSNSLYATINQTGELTVVNPGLVEVIASINTTNGYITKRKQILANLPQMYLTSTSTGTNTYCVEAKVSDLNVREYLRTKGIRDSLYFTWSLQMGEESLQTVTNRDSTFTVVLNDSTYNAVVCLSISLYGHTGETYSIIASRNDYYIWNIQEIHKTSSGITFQRYRPIRFPPEVGIPHFMISKNPAINAGEIPISHIRICGHNFYGTAGQYTPFLSNEIIDYLSFDIFAEDDVWGMIENMIPEFIQIMLEIDVYDLSGEVYQKITIPVIYDSAPPLPH